MQNPAQTFAAPAACAHCGAPFTPAVSGQTTCDPCQGLTHPEPASPLEQAEVAGFRLVQELGAGRYAHSWVAHDPHGQPVVLKLLRRYAPDAGAVERFLAEAQRLCTLDALDHPHLARPVTAGVHLVQAFFLVYASGGELTLADELRQRGRIPVPRALELCAQLCDGLAVAHRAGVVHRDLKPANVGVSKLSDGADRVLVLDLITSHLLASAGLQDQGPLPLSSAAYTSPEEAAGTQPDARGDFYAVGVLLFQLISGRLPMMGSTADELLEAHRSHPPLRLRDVGRRVHDELETLLARLLAKDPAQRPGHGDELAVMMRSLVPIADTAPMGDGADGIDDPVPVVEAPRPEPEVAAPPRMLAPAVDPALERAMMGEVPPQPIQRAPGIPKWAVRARPRWIAAVASAAGIAAVAFAAISLSRGPGGKASARAAGTAGVARGEERTAVTESSVARAAPPMVSQAMAPHAPESAAPPRPPAEASAVSPYAKIFDRAQKALWTGQTRSALGTLQDLWRKPLSRRDRARAGRMMGDAEAKKGNKAAAAAWYGKSLKFCDDQAGREKVEAALHRLR